MRFKLMMRRCKSSDKCVSLAQQCDGVQDCEDDSDEQTCNTVRFLFVFEDHSVFLK